MGRSEITGEFDVGSILKIWIEVLGGATSIGMGEEIWWLGDVISSARSSEVVCGEDWGSFHEGVPDEPKDDPLTRVSGVGDGGYSKDTDGIRAEGDEGSAEDGEQHDKRRRLARRI